MPVTSLQWCVYRIETQPRLILTSASPDGKVIFWDMSDKLSIPKRGFLISNQRSNTGKSILLPATQAVQCPKNKTEFLVGTSNGYLLRLQMPDKISDRTHSITFDNPSNSNKWTKEAVTLMSSISSNEKDKLFDLKTQLESFAKKEETEEITYDLMLSSEVDSLSLYPDTLRGEFTGHFRAVRAMRFNPVNQ